jgi:polyadenylation factor subunit 2
MVWSHNDNWMVTADHTGYIKYWQSNMSNLKMWQGHKEPIRGLRWVPWLERWLEVLARH